MERRAAILQLRLLVAVLRAEHRRADASSALASRANDLVTLTSTSYDGTADAEFTELVETARQLIGEMPDEGA